MTMHVCICWNLLYITWNVHEFVYFRSEINEKETQNITSEGVTRTIQSCITWLKVQFTAIYCKPVLIYIAEALLSSEKDISRSQSSEISQ
jgi:hypothetical protein